MTNKINDRKLRNNAWLRRQINDPYVYQAQKHGYRSRAAFKLLEIEAKFHLIASAKKILDLGSAPGSWLQVLVELGKQDIYGVDLLHVDTIKNATILLGDFMDNAIQKEIDGINFDLILSDISPNTTGHRQTDHLKLINIINGIVEFSAKNLVANGSLVMKIFHGERTEEITRRLKKMFSKVSFFKPKSSRTESVEIYLVCQKMLDIHLQIDNIAL